MRLLEVVQYESKLQDLFDTTGQIGDFEMQAHWAKYLCVLCSGYVENSVRLLYCDYAQKRSSSQISNFVSKKLRNFQNAKVEKIVELAKSFDEGWAADLENQTQGQIKESVNSIVANRHKIAHGKDTYVTVARVQQWHRESCKLVAIVESQCDCTA